MLTLPEALIARTFADAFVRPRNQYLLKVAVLLGRDFCEWLYGKWSAKWQRHPQPPQFYWTFKEMTTRVNNNDDPCLLAARLKPTSDISVPGEGTLTAKELLENPQRAATLLSQACIAVFRGGGAELRATARTLDYISYGLNVVSRSGEISKAIVNAIGDREAGEMAEPA